MTITEKIEHISKWTAENFEKEVNEINIGSGENDFAQIEKMVSEKLPKEFVEVYSKFNGEVGNQYGINNFWATRDLRSSQMVTESINESKTAAESATTKEPLVNESFKNDLVNKMKFRLNR